VIPALGLAEQDRHAGALDEKRERFIFDTTRHIAEYVEDRTAAGKEEKGGANVLRARAFPPVCIVGAHDEADHLAGLVLARVLPSPEFDPKVIPFPLLAAETIDQIAENACKVVCISAVPPNAAAHAGYLCKRLKMRLPELRVVVALWTSENTEKAQARLHDAGADQVVKSIPEAIEQLRQLCVPAALELQRGKQDAMA